MSEPAHSVRADDRMCAQAVAERIGMAWVSSIEVNRQAARRQLRRR
jgi:hypothetical protein